MTGQVHDIVQEAANNGVGEVRLVDVDDVLDDIVAKGILNQDESVLGNSMNKLRLVVTLSVVDAALQHTAAVTVSTNVNAGLANSIEDELSVC